MPSTSPRAWSTAAVINWTISWPTGDLDLARLLVGSEGTLAIITEATVRTVPRPKHRGLALLFFDRLESAARGALEITSLGVSTCDLMDRRLLTIAREMDVRYELLIPAEAEAMLLVEQSGDDAYEVGQRLREMVVRLVRERHLAFDARVTIEKEERDFYWRLSRRVVTTLYRLKGTTQAVPFIEDIAVPPETLPEFLVRMQNVFKKHAVTAALFAHLGHGQLHLRPFLDLANPEHQRLMQDLAADLYDEVLGVGGTISGEHSLGLSRSWFLRRQVGPLYEVFREVKRIFDPNNLLNPGKVVAEVPQPLTKNLRPPIPAQAPGAAPEGGEPPSPLVELELAWNWADITQATRACNGCGRCRTQGPEERMCPIFRFAPREEASPRAKANLLRAVLTGRLDPRGLLADELKSIADLCVNCHQCRFECPAVVDIPKLVLETKAQYVASNGLSMSDWFIARMDRLSAWGSAFSSLSNWAIRNRRMRWLLEKLIGIAQGRKLPRFESRSFLQLAHRRRLDRPSRRTGNKVLYFVDIYANWHDTQLAEALVAVLQHNGVAVYVHPQQVQCGMAAISMGAVDIARSPGGPQSGHPGRRGAARLPDHHHRAGGGAVLDARVPELVRRGRRAAGGEEFQRGLHVPVAAAPGRQAGTGPAAVERDLGLPPALPPEGPGCGQPRRGLAAADSRLDAAADRTRLFRNGGLLWHEAAELPHQSPRRLGTDLGTPQPDPAGGGDRVQRVQDPNGAGHVQTHDPSDQDPGVGLQLDAGSGRPADLAQRRSHGDMKATVRVFALARQLAGQESLAVDLPPGATVADLRRAIAEQYPALADLVAHALFAVNADYASDATPIPAGADLACIPPVSGG